MAALLVLCLLAALFFSFTTYSSAQYCLCKPGSQTPDPYEKVINYACGNGANCGPIQPNGLCYQANDIQAICSYAANSYYQNQKSLGATCDFGGVAAISNTLPSDVPSGCTYPTTSGPAGPVSNSTGIPTSPPGGINTPPGGMNTPPGVMNTPPGGMNPGPGMTSPPGIFSPTSFGPTGSFGDPGLSGATSLLQISSCIVSLSLTFFAGLLIVWG